MVGGAGGGVGGGVGGGAPGGLELKPAGVVVRGTVSQQSGGEGMVGGLGGGLVGDVGKGGHDNLVQISHRLS